MRGSLVLSPHPDDAALSLGGSLLARSLPQPVTIVTVFGSSNFMNGTWHADALEVTRRRRAEDEAFSVAVRTPLRYLTLPEASLRSDSMPVFDRATESPEILAEVRRAIADVTDELAPALVCAPLGLGNHRDHLMVRDAAGELGGTREVPVVYYEDLPYAADLSQRQIASRARWLDARLSAHVIEIDRVFEGKLRAVGIYVSQIGPRDVRRVVTHARRIPSLRARLARVWRRPWGLAAAERLWKSKDVRVEGGNEDSTVE